MYVECYGWSGIILDAVKGARSGKAKIAEICNGSDQDKQDREYIWRRKIQKRWGGVKSGKNIVWESMKRLNRKLDSCMKKTQEEV